MKTANRFSDTGASSTSSSLTKSLTSPAHTFANPISITKSALSPPSTTSYVDLSPRTTPSTASVSSLSPQTPTSSPGSPHSYCAYPSWPQGNFLSSSSCVSDSQCAALGEATSYVSDDDIYASLAGQAIVETVEADIRLEVSGREPWVYGGLGAVGASMPQLRILPPLQGRCIIPEKKSRRRSTAAKKRKSEGIMSPIAEGEER